MAARIDDGGRTAPRRGSRPTLAVEVVSSGRLRPRGLGPWLRDVAPAGAHGTVAVAILSDARVRALNRRYRGHDATTDVLSFPAHGGSPEPGAGTRKPAKAGSPKPAEARSRKPEALLGDIVIASGVAGRQAVRAGHSVQVELRVLALHGLLHLLGYDHERDDGRMARVERRLRRRGRLQAGLIERGRT